MAYEIAVGVTGLRRRAAQDGDRSGLRPAGDRASGPGARRNDPVQPRVGSIRRLGCLLPARRLVALARGGAVDPRPHHHAGYPFASYRAWRDDRRLACCCWRCHAGPLSQPPRRPRPDRRLGRGRPCRRGGDRARHDVTRAPRRRSSAASPCHSQPFAAGSRRRSFSTAYRRGRGVRRLPPCCLPASRSPPWPWPSPAC